MITVEHLTRRYGDVTAVHDVSFNIKRGEVVGLLGHNGAGKSTIMKMITGYLEPTSGKIAIDDLEMGRDTRAIQRRIGYLPENCPFWPEMTVIDHLDYHASLHGVSAQNRAKAVASALRRTVLETEATSPIQALSRGYRQRVGVAQAILHTPDIIILDEPTNGLDPTQIRHMRALIRELAKTATVVVSTHILQEVQAVCERVLIMRAGALVVDARLDDVQKSGGLLVTVGSDAAKTFSATDEITAVAEHREDSGRHVYRLETPVEAAPVIAAALAHAGISLYAMQPQQRDLETVFAEVNQEAVNG